MPTIDPNQTQKKTPPGEDQLEQLFRNFTPTPGERFYRRIASAPWKKASFRVRLDQSPGLRRFAIASLVLILVIAGFFAVPQLGAVARQMMYFFQPKASDQLTIQMTASSSGDTHDYSSEGYFSLTPEEASALAGYQIKTFDLLATQNLIPGLKFSGAHFDPDLKTVTLRYTAGNQNLYLSQHPVDSIKEYAAIGPSAMVEYVKVGEGQGEYVAGGWKLEHETSTPSSKGTQVSVDLTWDQDLPRLTLRWQAGGTLFEIASSALIRGERNFGKYEIIQVTGYIR